MKFFARSFLLLVPLALRAAVPSTVDVVVSGVPADATEIVVVADVVIAPTSEYEDAPAAAAVAPVVAPVPLPGAVVAAAPAPVAPEQQRRRRRQVVAPPMVRTAVPAAGTSSVTVRAAVQAGENYQVRAIALRGSDAFPVAVASGRVVGLNVAAGQPVNTTISLQAPALTPDPSNPAVVAPGARYTLAGKIKDPGHALGTKDRMRVWMSEGAPPRANYAGAQTSTVNVTSKDGEVSFQFELVAPKQPTVLYYQFGELPSDFARTDGSQAAFLVLPDLAGGAQPLQLRVEPAKVSANP